jgi:hypothetical protein
MTNYSGPATQLHRSAKELLAEADSLMRGKNFEEDFPVLDTPVAYTPARPVQAPQPMHNKRTTPIDNHSIQLVNQAIQPSALEQARKAGLKGDQVAAAPLVKHFDQGTPSDAIVSISDAYWDTLKEELFTRVMTRLDNHMDQRLRVRLESDLKPVLTRMMDKLAENVAEEVSNNVRRYVKKALEQEIETMRG